MRVHGSSFWLTIEHIEKSKTDKNGQKQQLREAATGLFQQADTLSWESLVAPFVRYAPLGDSKAQVETIVMRLANLVAKCDGQTMPEEAVALHTLQQQIDMALHPAQPKSTLAPLEARGTPRPAAVGNAAQQREYQHDHVQLLY